MIQQKILESLYESGPKTIQDLKRETGCDSAGTITFCAIDLSMGGLVDWDYDHGRWFYREDSWVA